MQVMSTIELQDKFNILGNIGVRKIKNFDLVQRRATPTESAMLTSKAERLGFDKKEIEAHVVLHKTPSGYIVRIKDSGIELLLKKHGVKQILRYSTQYACSTILKDGTGPLANVLAEDYVTSEDTIPETLTSSPLWKNSPRWAVSSYSLHKAALQFFISIKNEELANYIRLHEMFDLSGKTIPLSVKTDNKPAKTGKQKTVVVATPKKPKLHITTKAPTVTTDEIVAKHYDNNKDYYVEHLTKLEETVNKKTGDGLIHNRQNNNLQIFDNRNKISPTLFRTIRTQETLDGKVQMFSKNMAIIQYVNRHLYNIVRNEIDTVSSGKGFKAVLNTPTEQILQHNIQTILSAYNIARADDKTVEDALGLLERNENKIVMYKDLDAQKTLQNKPQDANTAGNNNSNNNSGDDIQSNKNM